MFFFSRSTCEMSSRKNSNSIVMSRWRSTPQTSHETTPMCRPTSHCSKAVEFVWGETTVSHFEILNLKFLSCWNLIGRSFQTECILEVRRFVVLKTYVEFAVMSPTEFIFFFFFCGSMSWAVWNGCGLLWWVSHIPEDDKKVYRENSVRKLKVLFLIVRELDTARWYREARQLNLTI